MKLGVLTSSRADYGIYRSLLKRLAVDHRFDLHLIAFGMHLLPSFGKTIREIENDSFGKIHVVSGMPSADNRVDIAKGYGELVKNFGIFWHNELFDFVLVLGDRWEMSAAVQATIPFEIKLAHIHGGEITLGATDNIFRHQITLASKLHFTATEAFSQRVSEIIGHSLNVETVGSLSLEEIDQLELPSWAEVQEKFEIPFDDFVLTTIHPESVNAKQNGNFADVAFEVISHLSNTYNFIITASNADIYGSIYNQKFLNLAEQRPDKVKFVQSFGGLNYFSAMKNCEFLLGNTSSGIIEAASFKKWVINIGDRQKGRLRSANVFDVSFDKSEILKEVERIGQLPKYEGKNQYFKKGTTSLIINKLLQNEEL